MSCAGRFVGYVRCHVCGHVITRLLQLFSVIAQLSDVTEQTEVRSADLSLTSEVYCGS